MGLLKTSLWFLCRTDQIEVRSDRLMWLSFSLRLVCNKSSLWLRFYLKIVRRIPFANSPDDKAECKAYKYCTVRKRHESHRRDAGNDYDTAIDATSIADADGDYHKRRARTCLRRAR